MNKTKTTPYDVAEHLRNPEEMAAYLNVCLEEANDNSALIAKALGDIARAKDLDQVARDAGLSSARLEKVLSGECRPGFDTVLRVLKALGLKLHAEVVWRVRVVLIFGFKPFTLSNSLLISVP